MAATTLAAAQTPTDLVASVDAAHTLEGDFLIQIDEELELVERRGQTTGWQVRRGMFGTTAASHLDNADVTIVMPQVQSGVLADPPASDGVANVAANVAVVAGTTPAGGTGATAGAYDTAGHRDALIATVAEIKTQLNAVIAALVAAGLMTAP